MVTGAEFHGVENLVGGEEHDQFAFQVGGSIDGGDDRVNTLDYSGWTTELRNFTTGIYANLTTGAATGVAGETSGGVRNNIRNIVGSHGSDILVGDEDQNVSWKFAALTNGSSRCYGTTVATK